MRGIFKLLLMPQLALETVWLTHRFLILSVCIAVRAVTFDTFMVQICLLALSPMVSLVYRRFLFVDQAFVLLLRLSA